MVEAVLRMRRKSSGRNAEAALRYAAMGWPVCPGAFLPVRAERGAAAMRACSCDRIGCPAPGAHPLSPAWQHLASIEPALVTRWWASVPEASVILPTGQVFDVLDVPAAVGTTALARIERGGRRPGPVATSSGRAFFFVRTRGAPADESEWWPCHLDCEPQEVAEVSGLRWHCRDSYVPAPPSRAPGGEPGRWLREPASYDLPDSLWVLEALADACEETG